MRFIDKGCEAAEVHPGEVAGESKVAAVSRSSKVCKLTGNQFGSRVSPGLSVTPAAYVTFSFLEEQQVCKEEGRRDSPIYEANKTINVYHKLIMCGRKVWF